MAQPLFTNNAATVLSAGINSSVTSLTVASGAGSLFPNPTGGNYFYITLITADSSGSEIVKCTARSGDTLTIVRGQEGTAARSFATGDSVQLRVTAQGLTDIINYGVLTVNGSSGNVTVTDITGNAATATRATTADQANSLNPIYSYAGVNLSLTGFLSTGLGMSFGSSSVSTGFYGDSTNIAIRGYSGGSIYFQNATGTVTYALLNSSGYTVYGAAGLAVPGGYVTVGSTGGSYTAFRYDGAVSINGGAYHYIVKEDAGNYGINITGNAGGATTITSNGGLQNMTAWNVGSLAVVWTDSYTGMPYSLNGGYTLPGKSGAWRCIDISSAQNSQHGCCTYSTYISTFVRYA